MTPLTISTNADYSFVLDTLTTIPDGGQIKIVFPTEITLGGTSACSFFFGLSGTPTCTSASNTLTISGAGVFPN